MGVSLKQNSDGSLGLQGTQLDEGGFLPVCVEYDGASSDLIFYAGSRPMVVKAITGRVTVAGTDAGVVTVVIKKLANGQSVALGTTLHAGTFNLKGASATVQSLTLSADAAVLQLSPTDALAVDFTGTLTGATGIIAVTLAPR